MTIYTLQDDNSSMLVVKSRNLLFFKSILSTSSVISLPFFSSSIRLLLTSKPKTEYFFPNSTARGSPTYPKPITAIFGSSFIIEIYPPTIISNTLDTIEQTFGYPRQ